MKIEIPITAKGKQIKDLLLITPKVHEDERGFFLESWNKATWNGLLEKHEQIKQDFVQDNHSLSDQGVLRGLHYQLSPHPQGKLIRCISGEIYDVAVDLRRHSKTFGHWVGVHLSANNFQQFWIPTGFAHGFLTLSKKAEVLYKTTDLWHKECERSLRWNDPNIGIIWPNGSGSPQLSLKDETAPLFSDFSKGDFFE